MGSQRLLLHLRTHLLSSQPGWHQLGSGGTALNRVGAGAAYSGGCEPLVFGEQ